MYNIIKYITKLSCTKLKFKVRVNSSNGTAVNFMHKSLVDKKEKISLV